MGDISQILMGRLSHKNKLSAEHNDHKILSANSQALLKGLMGPETRRNLCVFYTIIFYVSPDGGFTWSRDLSCCRAQLSLTVYKIVLIAY